MPDPINPKIYTVSELNLNIKSLLEETFPFVWVCGEISNFRMPVSGHLYFTLKDESSQVNVVMFRGVLKQLKFQPEDGLNVTGMGRVSVYEPRGAYQLIFEYMEPSGIGALQVAYEKLKARLAAEGYFDDARKRQIPFLAKKIAIITSPSGAVVHDMLKIIQRRFSNVSIEIVPVKVQGTGAEEEIVAGLSLINQRGDADVAILARGGGSLEDLQAFNSEQVATAIFGSKIPIISAVGHQTDFTIADFVADSRAPTPSAAAEMVLPEKTELQRRCAELTSLLKITINSYIKSLRLKTNLLSETLLDPRKRIFDLRLRIDDLSVRLNRLIFACLKTKHERCDWWKDRLQANSPLLHIKNLSERLDLSRRNLIKSLVTFKDFNRARLRELTVRLHTLSPMAILQRGYSITRTIPKAHIVKSTAMVAVNQEIEVILAKGRLVCRVKGKLTNG